MKSSEILQFKITLNQSQPKIWRRIQVSADYTFFELHCAIQDAMGWMDCHLHAFVFTDKKDRKQSIRIATPSPDDDPYNDDMIDERVTCVESYFKNISKQCIYDYDFGDSWEHTVLFEKSLITEKGKKYPQCIAGTNACPPEDCGGLWGYYDLIDILKNPKHERYSEIMDWLEIDNLDEFDPAAFDPAEVYFENPKKRLVEWNRQLEKY